jgi:hypothetical protein
MKPLPLTCGLLAVALYLLCFQLKSAKRILACKFFSNILYVLQYLLLGAFVGAALDTAAVITTGLGCAKDKPLIVKYKTLVLILIHAGILATGILLYQNLFSLFAIAGALLESAANWMKKEKMIRIVSLLAVPCWFIYNTACGAWGSVLGNILAAISIITALIRYAKKIESTTPKT